MGSPYAGLPIDKWEDRTRQLILKHPLDSMEIHDVVHQVWENIFSSKVGDKPFRIGIDILPRPQIMAFFSMN